jgi:hypothetical protein
LIAAAAAIAVTSQGTAHGRFRRAIQRPASTLNNLALVVIT